MSFRDSIAALKALGDENRLRALLAMSGRELCVCQITELLQLAPSTVSKHMSILRQADLVESRKDGRWIYYRLATDYAPQSVQTLVRELQSELADDPKWKRDQKSLEEILATDPEILCRRQAGTDSSPGDCEDGICCLPEPETAMQTEGMGNPCN